MRFKIGDHVAVLDDTLKGVVIAIKSNQIVIEDEEKMAYSYDPSELVLIEKEQYQLSKFGDINNPHFLEKKKEEQRKKKVFKKAIPEVVLEVDLHINQLKKTTKGMDNYDILTFQLDIAKQKLEFAQRKRIPKVVFIHGVGEGVLKSELGFLLNKYPVQYYDASYQKYGMGATEVYIYQNSNS